MNKCLICFTLILLCANTLCFAQYGDYALDETADRNLLTIKELNEQGQYLQAILQTEQSSHYKSLGEIVSAAKSAWALSLVSSSRKYWDQALAHKDCIGIERARILLARGLMEFQERNYEEARALAEEGASHVGESELRGELWLLVGESLKAQDLFSISETYFEKASAEAEGDRKQEALLLLAQVQKHLGKLQPARETLTRVELNSKVTTRALNELVSIDSKANNSQGVRTWISEGKKAYPSEFNTSEHSYQQVRAMLADEMFTDASKEVSRINKEVHGEDVWLHLSKALIEEYQGKKYLEEVSK